MDIVFFFLRVHVHTGAQAYISPCVHSPVLLVQVPPFCACAVRCTMTRHIIVHSGLSLGRVAGSHDAADVDPLLAVAPMSIMSVYHPLRTANKAKIAETP
jgi:hypothetical protein